VSEWQGVTVSGWQCLSGREWQCLHILVQAGEVQRYKPGGKGSSHDWGDDLHCKYSGQKHFTSTRKIVILSLMCLFGPTMG
jgi:hypothetical protein